jgi:hypothetical protein
MFRVRTVNDVDEFVGVPGDPDGYTDTVKGLWDSGESQPDWCFLIEDGPTNLGRVGFRVSPTVSDPSLQGSLPAQELFVYGLHLQWEDDYLKAGRRLIAEATAAVSAELPELLEVRINNSVHPFAEERVHLMNDMGMHLFQEKDGFFWSDDGHLVESVLNFCRLPTLVWRPTGRLWHPAAWTPSTETTATTGPGVVLTIGQHR